MTIFEKATTCWLILPLLFCLSGCTEKEERTKPPRLVLTTVVGNSSTNEQVFTGTIEPRYRNDLSFRVVGRILARDVEVGDLVKKGQRVAALDPASLEFAVRSQRAALANAQASYATAAATEERQRTLRDRDVTAQAAFETSEQARIAATADVTRAQSNLAKALEQLTYAELRSDFDGVVTGIGAEIGQVVNVGQTVVSVARPDIREAAVYIPEISGLIVTPGTVFDVALQLDETVHTSGTVREIAPEADPVTRARRALITLDTPPEPFRLGSTVTVRLIPGSSKQDAILLPASAVFEREGKDLIFVVDEEKKSLVETNVTVVKQSDDVALVSGPLSAKTRVVVAGVKSLKAGEQVRFDAGAQRE